MKYRNNAPSHDPQRRRTLRGIAALGAMAAFGSNVRAASSGLLQRPIPSSGESLPAIGLGTARTFDVGTGSSDRAPLREVLRLFVEAGGSVVDSSPMYGNAERVVGDLAIDLGVGEQLFSATKVWTRGTEQGVRQMEASMRRMRAQPLDLIQVHNLLDWRTQLNTLYDWREAGRVRYIGITHYRSNAFDDLERIMRRERLDFVQLPYSIADREAERRLLPLAADRGIATLINVPFARGRLFRAVRGKPLPAWAAEFDCGSWAQFFLKYLLGHPAVTCPIPATSKPKHLLDNMGAGQGALPDAAMREWMATYFKGL